MDRALKQRLVGATILIALAVIFVPMWVGKPQPDQHTERRAAPELPEPPAEREVHRIPLGPTARDDDPGQPSADPESEPGARELPEPEVETVVQAEDPEPETATAPAEPVPEPETTEPVAQTPQPVSSDPVQPEPATPESATPEPATPEPAVPALADDRAEPAAEGDWLVQVASFGNANSANSLAERVSALGFNTVIDTAVRGEGQLHRVRAGPFEQRAEADQARARIANGIAGVEPAVINIRGAAADTSSAAAASAANAYSVQVGVFTREENATALRDRLSGQGFTCFIDSQTSNERTTWRVRAGPVITREEAERLRERLQREAGLEGMVVGHP